MTMKKKVGTSLGVSEETKALIVRVQAEQTLLGLDAKSADDVVRHLVAAWDLWPREELQKRIDSLTRVK